MSFKKGPNWGEEEIRVFLEMCIEKQVLAIMDGKRHKHVEIFRMLEPQMKEKGYAKTADQMKLKLKNLKLAYFKCRRDNSVSGAATSRCVFYNELELLYGCRPTAEAGSSSSGIDTASAVNEDNETEETSVNDEIVNINNCDTIINEEEEEEENKNDEVPKKKRRKCNGRKSYQTTLDNYTDKWLETQKNILNTMLERQDKMQKELIQEEMAKQREWEEREMEKERNFQREQTNLIMQTFSHSIHSLRPQIPVLSHNYTPLKLIPMKQAGPSSVNILKQTTTNTIETLDKENLPKT